MLEDKLIQLAHEKVKECVKQKSMHVSVIVRRNRILSIGLNSMHRSHPLAYKFNYHSARIHSEIASLIHFRYDSEYLRKCSMWNIRIDKWNQVKLSKPCSQCIIVLNLYGLKEVFYTGDQGGFLQL